MTDPDIIQGMPLAEPTQPRRPGELTDEQRLQQAFATPPELRPRIILRFGADEKTIAAAGRGTDVYLFLVGMMLLSEVARQEGLFDFLARLAVGWSAGSRTRLFFIVYAVGTVVTAFMSNDATRWFHPERTGLRPRHGPFSSGAAVNASDLGRTDVRRVS